MFKYKTDAEVQAMTEQEANDYAVAKRDHEQKMQKDAIEKALSPLQDELTKVKEDNTELALKITTLETKGSDADVSLKGQLKSFLKENEAKIQEMYKSGSGSVEMVLKAVGTVTTASGTNTAPPAITGTQQSGLGNVMYRNLDITGLTTNVNTSLAAYPYTETVPKDGDYSFLAEGGTKPQVDFTWETNYAKPVKAAAWIKLTEESVKDVVGLQSVANDLLVKKHALKKAKGILYGDGISPNPKGATTYGRTFSAGALALAVVKPNFMDVVNACITDIATTHNFEDEVPYMANLVMVNPNDFYIQMVSAKDENGLPLYPQASLFNQVVIGGVTIIPEETITAGKIFVCDMSKYNTTNYVPYSVRIGWVNDDFIKNQFVILAESRFHAFVKKLDEQAFIYDTIATVKSAITKA
jgi:hypothetical protein